MMLTIKIDLRVVVLLAVLITPLALVTAQGEPFQSTIAGYEILVDTTPSNEKDYKDITLSCPEGKRVLSGGAGIFHSSSSEPDGVPRLVSSFLYPDATTWYAEAVQPSDAVGNWHIEIQVICAF